MHACGSEIFRWTCRGEAETARLLAAVIIGSHHGARIGQPGNPSCLRSLFARMR